MKKSHLLLMAILSLSIAFFVGPVLCIAADAVEVLGNTTGTPLGQALAGFMTDVVFPIGNALLVALIGWVMLKIGTKYKIDALASKEDLIQSAALKGIALAEEYAANKLKTANFKLTSNEKLNLAVAQVLKAAPKLTEDEAKDYVNSMLAKVAGAGATGDKTV